MIEPVNSVRDQSNPDPAEDKEAQRTRQEPKRGIGKDIQDGFVRKRGRGIDVIEKYGNSHPEKCDPQQDEEEPAFDSQSGSEPAAQIPDILDETVSFCLTQIMHTRSVAGRGIRV